MVLLISALLTLIAVPFPDAADGRLGPAWRPAVVELANIKGAAVQNTSKPAILETGLEIKVPPYIEQGNRVKIDTRTGEFVERV